VKEGDFVSAEMHVNCGKCLQLPHRRSAHCQKRKDYYVLADVRFAGAALQAFAAIDVHFGGDEVAFLPPW